MTLNFNTTAFWSDASSFAPEVAQPTLTCGASITTPVTLASFSSLIGGGITTVLWTSATEVGVIGFHLFEELEDGWKRVTSEPIAARGVDSTAPQSYRLETSTSSARRLLLESLDYDGKKQLHGPFEVGRSYGQEATVTTVPWLRLRQQSEGAQESLTGKATSTEAVVSALKAEERPQVDLLVDRDGLYRVTYESLAAAGFDFAGTPVSHLALTFRGEPVPMRVQPGTRQRGRSFGPGGSLEFYGRGLDSLYTKTAVYRLLLAPSQARRVDIDRSSPSGEPATVYMETSLRQRDLRYSFASPLADPWFDTRMLVFSAPKQHEFELRVEDSVDGPGVLEVDLWGVTDFPQDPDHHIRLWLNGQLLDDQLFDGRTAHRLSVSLPRGLVNEGANTLVLEQPADLGIAFDLIHLEALRLSYPRRTRARQGTLTLSTRGSFEVSELPPGEIVAYRLPEGDAPQWLAKQKLRPVSGSQTVTLAGPEEAEALYAVSSVQNLLSPELVPRPPEVDLTSGSVDYLMLSHGGFIEALEPLVSFHEGRGLTVKVVDVADVYQQFGHGMVDPEALRAYIRHAAREMGLRFVLLVGGDTYDYLDHLGLGSISFVPSLYAPTGDLITAAPADPLFTDLDGDGVSDIPLGRMPVRTVAELEALIAKSQDYAAKPYDRTAVFAADHFDAGAGVSFTRHSEELRQSLGSDWQSRQAYLDRLEMANARQILLGAVEEGVALTTFVGHSGPTSWTFEGLFSSSDAAALSNSGRPTVVVQWGCWNSYHVQPDFETMAHALLLSGDRGAAAVLGASTLMDSSSAEKMSRLLAPLLTQPGLTVGEAPDLRQGGLGRGAPGPHRCAARLEPAR